MSKRGEMLEWAKSLKPGDKVIHDEYGRYSILEVERVTPSGIVKTIGGKSFAQNSFSDRLLGRGQFVSGYILPFTDELLQAAKEQEAKREEEKRKRSVIHRANDIIYEEYRAAGRMTYERALKIIAVLDDGT